MAVQSSYTQTEMYSNVLIVRKPSVLIVITLFMVHCTIVQDVLSCCNGTIIVQDVLYVLL